MPVTVNASLQSLTLSATASQGAVLDGPMTTTVSSSTSMTPVLIHVVVISTSVSTSTSMTPLRLLDALMSTSVGAATSATGLMTIPAVMTTVVSISATAPALADPSYAWVVNWETNSSTTYENFAFNSFAQSLPGEYLGARADGIYVLDGDTDAGTSIQSSINFGRLDFGSQSIKSLVAAYIGAASNGRLYLKVRYSDERGEHEYIYAARRDDTHQRTQKVDIGRGIKGHLINFELYNSDGADFELRSVTFVVADIKRRV